MGQVQAATNIGLNNSHKVRRGGSQGDEMYFLQKYITFQRGVLLPLSQIGHLFEVLWQVSMEHFLSEVGPAFTLMSVSI